VAWPDSSAFSVSRIGHEGGAAASPLGDAGPPHGDTVDRDGVRVRGEHLAAQRGEEFVLAVAGDASHAEHLAGAHDEADGGERDAMGMLRGQRKGRDREPHRAVFARPVVAHGRDVAAHHHAREAGRGLGARVAARDHLPGAQDGRRLADAAHLLELVGDVENRAAFPAQT
jgi:hypothetical protein